MQIVFEAVGAFVCAALIFYGFRAYFFPPSGNVTTTTNTTGKSEEL